jgi:hypothetical protein
MIYPNHRLILESTKEEILFEHFGDGNTTDDKYLLYYEIVDSDGSFVGDVNPMTFCHVATLEQNGRESCPHEVKELGRWISESGGESL